MWGQQALQLALLSFVHQYCTLPGLAAVSWTASTFARMAMWGRQEQLLLLVSHRCLSLPGRTGVCNPAQCQEDTVGSASAAAGSALPINTASPLASQQSSPLFCARMAIGWGGGGGRTAAGSDPCPHILPSHTAAWSPALCQEGESGATRAAAGRAQPPPSTLHTPWPPSCLIASCTKGNVGGSEQLLACSLPSYAPWPQCCLSPGAAAGGGCWGAGAAAGEWGALRSRPGGGPEDRVFLRPEGLPGPGPWPGQGPARAGPVLLHRGLCPERGSGGSCQRGRSAPFSPGTLAQI